MVLGVKFARWVLPEKEPTKMPLNANNVHWVKQQRLKVPQNAMLVMPGNSENPKVSVTTARLDFIKTTKVKTNALGAQWEKRTSMPKPLAVIATKDNLESARALVKHAPPGFIKIPKAKTHATPIVFRQTKYPTTKAPGVNCHRGVLAKWANI